MTGLVQRHVADDPAFGEALLREGFGTMLDFVQMMIEHLTARGIMDPRLLYESPFTDMDPLGVEGLFGEPEVLQLVQILADIGRRAAAA